MKLTTKLKNGKLQVNKAAVLAKLRKAVKLRREALTHGVIPVSQREVEAEAREMVRYNADSLINTSEE